MGKRHQTRLPAEQSFILVCLRQDTTTCQGLVPGQSHTWEPCGAFPSYRFGRSRANLGLTSPPSTVVLDQGFSTSAQADIRSQAFSVVGVGVGGGGGGVLSEGGC